MSCKSWGTTLGEQVQTALDQLIGSSLAHHAGHVGELHQAGPLPREADRRGGRQHPLRLAGPVALEEGVLLEPGQRLGEQRHQELLQADHAVLQKHVAGNRIAGKLPRLQLQLLELRLRLGAGLRSAVQYIWTPPKHGQRRPPARCLTSRYGICMEAAAIGTTKGAGADEGLFRHDGHGAAGRTPAARCSRR